MTRRKVKNDRQEPEFGYTRHSEPYFDEPRASPSHRAIRARRGDRSLVPLFLVGAVIILFGGFLWISYVKGPKLVGGQLPVITADSTPVKVKPDNPGGADIPFQDTTVYDDLNQGKQKHAAPEVEHLLQPPEQPLPMPAAPAPVAEAQPAQAATPVPVQSAPEAVAPAATVSVPAPPASSQEDAAPAITSDNEAALAPQSDPTPAAPAKLPPPPPEAALPTPVAPITKPVPKTSDAAVKPKPSAAATGAHNSIIQLGSFKDEDAAKTEWQRLKKRYSDQLSTLSPIIQRVDLGEKGVWYRLRAGSLTIDKAKAICIALTDAKAPCIASTH